MKLKIFTFIILLNLRFISCGNLLNNIVKHPFVGNATLAGVIYSGLVENMGDMRQQGSFVLYMWSSCVNISLGVLYLNSLLGTYEDRCILASSDDRQHSQLNFLRREIGVISSSFVTLYAGYMLYRRFERTNTKNMGFLLITTFLGAARAYTNIESYFKNEE